MKQLYLEIYEYGTTIIAPIETLSVLFVLKYLKTRVPLTLIKDSFKTSNFSFPAAVFDKFHITVISKAELCLEAKNCALPAICVEENLMFVTGLCAVIRRILKYAKENGRAEISQKLLGFRGGCLTACAEVSVWTKFCEIDVLNTAKNIISRATTGSELTKIPVDLLRFEAHLQQPVRVHNIYKKRQDLAKTYRNNSKTNCNVTARSEYPPLVENNPSAATSSRVLESQEAADVNSDKNLPPWLRTKSKLVRLEYNRDSDQSVEDLMLEMSRVAVDNNGECFSSTVGESLPHLTHAYAEGADMTLADVILFSYIHLILLALQKHVNDLRFQIPLILKWYSRVVLDENIIFAMSELNFKFDLIEAIGDHSENAARCLIDETVAMPDVVKIRTENQNISHFRTPHRDSYQRSSKTKMFTRQNEIDNVFGKLKEANIEVAYSQHPCSNVALDWTALPEVAHPSFGELPNSRILRKCQQIENLVSVVLKVAKQGDVIVDFCSGGGHLGIVLAYLLPRCRVVMIDNKEESLIRAKQRVQVLGLTNTVLYQSNLEYFTGHFEIGTSLHACGVATDLVLKRCIDERATFVVCPCCYGAVQNNHLITYPRSDTFKQIGISYKDYLVLGHSADQTHINDPKSEQGKQCMGFIDTDRLNQCAIFEYKRLLCTLTPTTCTPKNNLLIGFPASIKAIEKC